MGAKQWIVRSIYLRESGTGLPRGADVVYSTVYPCSSSVYRCRPIIPHSTGEVMTKTKQTAVKSTDGRAPRMELAVKVARVSLKSVPDPLSKRTDITEF